MKKTNCVDVKGEERQSSRPGNLAEKNSSYSHSYVSFASPAQQPTSRAVGPPSNPSISPWSDCFSIRKMQLQRDQFSQQSISEHYSSFVELIHQKYGFNVYEATPVQQQEIKIQKKQTAPKYRLGWQLETVPEPNTKPPKPRKSKEKSSTVRPSIPGFKLYGSSLTYKKKVEVPQRQKSRQYDLEDPRLQIKIMNQNLKYDPKKKSHRRRSRRKSRQISLLPATVDLSQIVLQ